MKFSELVRLVTPPVFPLLAQRLRRERNPRVDWEYVPDGWAHAQAHPEVKGWNVKDVLETYQKKWPKFVSMVQGTGPLGIAHESNLSSNEDILSHNALMTLGYSLARAVGTKDRLSVLDWGGGIGHYYLLVQALLPGVEIEYHCKDVPLLCEYGAQLFPQQHFYADDRCFENVYDFVLASASLHYAEDWQSLLQRLAGVTRSFLYIANLPTVLQAPSFVFVQRPYKHGYNTEYLGWCLNKTEVLKTADRAGLHLLREFVYGHKPVIDGAPEQNAYRGYLFQAPQQGIP